MGKRAAAIYQINTLDRIEAKLDALQAKLDKFEAPEIEPAQPGFDPAELIAKIDALLERFGFVEDEPGPEPEKAPEPKAPKKAKK